MSELREPLPKSPTDVMEPPLDPEDETGLDDPEEDEDDDLDDPEDPEDPEDEDEIIEDEDDEPDEEDIPLVDATENRR